MSVPARSDYTIDVLAYKRLPGVGTWSPVLSVARATGIVVKPGETTHVSMESAPLEFTYTAPDNLTSGDPFSVELVVTGPNIFESATARFRIEKEKWLSDSGLWLDTFVTEKVSSTSTEVTIRSAAIPAPTVNETTEYFYGFRFQLSTKYGGSSDEMPIFSVYAPSLTVGDELRTIPIKPGEGSIIIEL